MEASFYNELCKSEGGFYRQILNALLKEIAKIWGSSSWLAQMTKPRLLMENRLFHTHMRTHKNWKFNHFQPIVLQKEISRSPYMVQKRNSGHWSAAYIISENTASNAEKKY